MKFNKVVKLDAPIKQDELRALNDAGWELFQVVPQQYEHYKKSSGYNNIDKIFYRFKYHHYFTRNV